MRKWTFACFLTLMMAGTTILAPVTAQASGGDTAGGLDWDGAIPDWYDPDFDDGEDGAPDYGYYRYQTDDGNIYYLVLSDCTWTEAFARASDAGGHLVHINGWTEYSTLLHKIIDFGLTDYRFRIGARREPDSYEYHWVDEDGELEDEVINDPSYWSWTRWITGGPSFESNGFDEDVIQVFFYPPESRWVWNDVPDDVVSTSDFFSGREGYVVEFDPDSEGYDDAFRGWDMLDGGLYDAAWQSGEDLPYDAYSQSGE